MHFAVENLEISLFHFQIIHIWMPFKFYSNAMHYGYIHSFWLVKQLLGTIQTNRFLVIFSVMPHTTTSGWVTSHSNVECLMQVSYKISLLPKTPINPENFGNMSSMSGNVKENHKNILNFQYFQKIVISSVFTNNWNFVHIIIGLRFYTDLAENL